MKYARRGNEYLRIEDSAAESYKKGGYDILDEKGEKVIEKAVKDNYSVAEYNALQAKYDKLQSEYNALQAKYDKLQSEYNALEKKLKNKPKDDKPEEADKT